MDFDELEKVCKWINILIKEPEAPNRVDINNISIYKCGANLVRIDIKTK